MIDIHVLTAVVGITGMGKSYWTKKKLIDAIAEHQPVIIFDKDGEYYGPKANDIPEKNDWKGFNGIHEFMVHLNKTEFLDGVYVIECNRIQDFDYGIKVIRAMELPVCMLLEEAHWIFTENDLKDLQNILKDVARMGRKKNMGLALITQRFLDIPKNIRTQLRGVISFHQNDWNDVESLKKFDSKAPDKIVDFKPYEYEIFGELPEKIIKRL